MNCGNLSPSIMISDGYNLSNDRSCNLTQPTDKPNNANAKLGPLQIHAADATATYALLPGSAAIDTTDCNALSNLGLADLVDQRGIVRPQGQQCDIGAYEVQPSVALDDLYKTIMNSPLSVAAPGVLQNDGNPNHRQKLMALKRSEPSHGTLEFNSDGSFTYSPTLDFTGTDRFTYQARDSVADSNIMTVMITVFQPKEAPVAKDDTYTTEVATSLGKTLIVNIAQGVLANDRDPANLPLTAVLVNNAAHGALTLNADGSLTYTPAWGYIGSDSFTYRAYNNTFSSKTATGLISVYRPNHLPIAVDDSFSTTIASTVSGNLLANDSDPDGDKLQAFKPSEPSHGKLTVDAVGPFTYTPALGFTGTDHFTYQANDSLADSNVATVTLTVNNQPTVANADAFMTTLDTPLTVATPGVLKNDHDPDSSQKLNAIKVSDPGSGTLTLNADGSFIYTPTLGFTGTDSFTYKANDGLADSNAVSVTITVRSNRATLTIGVDAQPDSKTNFRFDGSLGLFRLDESMPDDGDVYTQTQTFVVEQGIYTITEQSITSWPLMVINCNSPTASAVNLSTGQVVITLATGDNITCTFTHQHAGKLVVGKYNDHDHNSARNSEDEWLREWTMQLFTDPSTQVGSQNTGENGRTSFTNLRPGNYTVCEVMQEGWFHITPSRLNRIYQKPCYTVTIEPGQTLDVRFGNSTTPLVVAAVVRDFRDVIVTDLPDTDSDRNVVASLPDPWPAAPEEQSNPIFRPLVNR